MLHTLVCNLFVFFCLFLSYRLVQSAFKLDIFEEPSGKRIAWGCFLIVLFTVVLVPLIACGLIFIWTFLRIVLFS